MDHVSDICDPILYKLTRVNVHQPYSYLNALSSKDTDEAYVQESINKEQPSNTVIDNNDTNHISLLGNTRKQSYNLKGNQRYPSRTDAEDM